MITKQFGTKLSALALALLLIGCGGGGSDGYYNSGSTNNNGSTSGDGSSSGEEDGNQEETELPTLNNAFTQLISSKTALLVNGDTAALQIQLLDSARGGSWSEQIISLQIVDAQKYGVSYSPSTQSTDENGFVNFNLQLNPINLSNDSKNELLTQGLKVNILNAQGSVISTHQLSVIASEDQRPEYDLVISSNKNELSLTGDNALVNVRAVDTNGGSLSNKQITLSLLDYTHVRLESMSTLMTDEFGDAKFKITLLPTSGNAINDLKNNGINVLATITDDNGIKVSKPLNIKVVDGVTTTPVGQITLGNAGLLSKSSDSVYYTEKFSAQVVDADGKPIKTPQKVTMKIDIVSSQKGYFLTASQLNAMRDQDVLNFENARIKPVNDAIASLELLKAQKELEIAKLDKNAADYESDKKQLENEVLDTDYDIKVENSKLAALNAQIALVNRINIPQRVQWECGNNNNSSYLATSLVDQSNDSLGSHYEYTTDNTGKFDFNINYQRRYAKWQTVLFTVSAKRADGTVIESKMTYSLGALKEDVDAAISQPFDSSPFNQTASDQCTYVHPWAVFLN